MLCPYCHQAMKKGYMQALSNILYVNKPHVLKMKPSNEDEILLARQSATPATMMIYRCISCKKMIIDEQDIIK